MAIIVKTSNPSRLYQKIKDKVNSENPLETWSLDKDGDFTHSPPQWDKKAWLRPTIESDHLKLRIIPPKGSHISRTTYAVYHGRFIEMLLTHFDEHFHEAHATAMPALGDIIK